jgi:hypothetical protein
VFACTLPQHIETWATAEHAMIHTRPLQQQCDCPHLTGSLSAGELSLARQVGGGQRLVMGSNSRANMAK